MNGRWGGRGISEETILVLMAVAAVLLAMSVVTSLSGDAADPDRPRASFVFETNGTDVLVTHYGGDDVDGSALYVESERRGSLGNWSAEGGACATPVSNVTAGTTCLVADAAYEQLYVVWRGPGEDRLVLDRRPAADTPTPTPTATPTVTPTPTATPTPTPTLTVTPTPAPNGTTVPGTPDNATATPAPNGTAGPTGTPTNGTAAGGTATPAGTDTGTPTGADTPTAAPTGG